MGGSLCVCVVWEDSVCGAGSRVKVGRERVRKDRIRKNMS